jgi:tripartite-type tricarboxylate transporter receptor subunit TctC
MGTFVIRRLAGVVFAFAAFAASAQEWPTQPIRLIVAFPPGGTVDQFARLVQAPLQQALGQPVIVENRSGGSGSIGTAVVAKSAPDGYTWVCVFDTHGVNQSLIPNLPYDTLKDLSPLILIGVAPMLMTAHPSSPYKSWADIVAASKKDPGSVAFGTIGSGSLGHLAMANVGNKLGFQMTHIPYKGGGPLTQDALAGHVPVAIASAALLTPHVLSGKLRPIAVTSAERFAGLPNVPTLAELGVTGFSAYSWWGVNGPAGVPPAIVAKMHKAYADALRSPAVKEKLEQQGVTLRISSPEEYQRFIENEVTTWAQVVKANNIKSE